MMWANIVSVACSPGNTTFQKVPCLTFRALCPHRKVPRTGRRSSQTWLTSPPTTRTRRTELRRPPSNCTRATPCHWIFLWPASTLCESAARLRAWPQGRKRSSRCGAVTRTRSTSLPRSTRRASSKSSMSLRGAYTVIAMTVMADRPQLARSTVEVKDADVDGLRRAPLAGATVRGKVRLAGNVGEADASLLFVYLRRAEGEDDVS